MKEKKNKVVDTCDSKPANPVGRSTLDPLGSYTGRAIDPFEKPVQDADDL